MLAILTNNLIRNGAQVHTVATLARPAQTGVIINRHVASNGVYYYIRTDSGQYLWYPAGEVRYSKP